MKNIIVFFTILIFSINLFGVSIDENTAQNAATYWLSHNYEGTRDFSISQTFQHSIDDKTCLYIFNYSNGGFVIITADDYVKPILGYSFENTFEEKIENPSAKWFIEEMAQQTYFAIENNIRNQNYEQEWQNLLEHNLQPVERDRNVSPMLSCNWNQDSSWNLLCPADNSGPGGHVYVGCVAVAMAQVMYFWEYPTTSTGSHGYTHSTYGYLFEEFGNYNFDSMADNYATTQSRTILYHAGVAVNMDYGPDGSGANSSMAEYAMKYYFDFSLETELLERDNYTQSDWEEIYNAYH